MESSFEAIFFLAAGIFYLRVLGNYGVRNLTAANIFLLFTAKYCDGDISTEVQFSEIFLMLTAAALCLGLAEWKYAEILTCQLYLFYCFVLQWPDFYLKLYPNNNLEEDFGWGIYSTQIVYTMFAAACVVLFLFWVLNRVLWKSSLLRIVNWGIGAILFHRSAEAFLRFRGLNGNRFLLWTAAFLLAFFLCQKESLRQEIGRMVSMGLSLLLFAGLWAGVMEYTRESVKPQITAYETEPYEYLVMVNKEIEEKTILFNERGEKVLQVECNFVFGEAFPNAFLIGIADSTGTYLINETGEILADSYELKEFIPQEDLVLVWDPSEEKYGGLNSRGETEISFVYDSLEELEKAELIKRQHKKAGPPVYYEGLQLTGDIGAMGVAAEGGKEILSQRFWRTGFFTNGSDLICADTGRDGEYVLYDRKGTPVFSISSALGIWDDCENGWFRAEEMREDESVTYFLNEKFERVLELERGYKADGGFQKIRSRKTE